MECPGEKYRAPEICVPALTEFLSAADTDDRIGNLHICIFVALFKYWCLSGFQNPVQITRNQIMQAAKVRRTTYHKCIKELDAFGYIEYLPSYHPVLGSAVYFKIIDEQRIA